jgi:hypothetical protein
MENKLERYALMQVLIWIWNLIICRTFSGISKEEGKK